MCAREQWHAHIKGGVRTLVFSVVVANKLVYFCSALLVQFSLQVSNGQSYELGVRYAFMSIIGFYNVQF